MNSSFLLVVKPHWFNSMKILTEHIEKSWQTNSFSAIGTHTVTLQYIRKNLIPTPIFYLTN